MCKIALVSDAAFTIRVSKMMCCRTGVNLAGNHHFCFCESLFWILSQVIIWLLWQRWFQRNSTRKITSGGRGEGWSEGSSEGGIIKSEGEVWQWTNKVLMWLQKEKIMENKKGSKELRESRRRYRKEEGEQQRKDGGSQRKKWEGGNRIRKRWTNKWKKIGVMRGQEEADEEQFERKEEQREARVKKVQLNTAMKTRVEY